MTNTIHMMAVVPLLTLLTLLESSGEVGVGMCESSGVGEGDLVTQSGVCSPHPPSTLLSPSRSSLKVGLDSRAEENSRGRGGGRRGSDLCYSPPVAHEC